MLTAAVVLAVQAVLTAQAPPDAVTVHVFADVVQHGYGDVAAKDRADSLKDLIEAFLNSGMGRERTIVLVDSADDADVLVEVISRRRAPTRGPAGVTTVAPFGQPSASMTPPTLPAVLLRLSTDFYKTDLESRATSRSPTWKTAATSGASDILDWIQMNREQLVAARGAGRSEF